MLFSRSCCLSTLWVVVCQFSSVAQSSPTLFDPMNHITPGLPVHHQLPESTQTHVHPTISSSVVPFSSHLKFFPASGSFPMSQFFASGCNVLEFQLQHQSFWWMFRTDLLYDWLAGYPCHPRDSQESSPTPQLKSINSLSLSLLHSPTLTSIHDYWKNHSLD